MSATVGPRTAATRRAIGIVRVSQTKGREGDSFHSPEVQRERIRVACEAKGWRLTDVIPELDVSGGRALADRPGLRAAVEAIEHGRADVLVAAYLDRLTRDPHVRDEAIDRVERAGGEVFAADMGRQTNGTAVEQLTGTLAAAVGRYVRRVAAERSADAQRRAVERGVLPWPNVPPGYVRGDDGVLQVDPVAAPNVAAAFKMRADGATVAAVRAYLAEHGIRRSYHGVGSLLSSRVVLGQIVFGRLVNESAHPAIVDVDTWRRVQRVSVPRGRKPKSDRLLARLGVLRCGSCGGRMVVGIQTARGRSYRFYRCGHVREDCADRVTVSADMAERVVTDAVRAQLADAEGRASAQANAQDAERALADTQAALDAAFRTFAGFDDEAAARERLAELRQARDDAQARVEQVGASRSQLTINADLDWERLSLDARRALIRATVDRAVVTPGRGPDRITVHLLGQ